VQVVVSAALRIECKSLLNQQARADRSISVLIKLSIVAIFHSEMSHVQLATLTKFPRLLPILQCECYYCVLLPYS